RAAALKQLAPLARDAFQPRSEVLPPGVATFTDPLPGLLRTLPVYAVLGTSPAGVQSTWPASADSVVVVEVPHGPEPARAVVVRAQWQPPLVEGAVLSADAARVELLIAEPPTPVSVPPGK